MLTAWEDGGLAHAAIYWGRLQFGMRRGGWPARCDRRRDQALYTRRDVDLDMYLEHVVVIAKGSLTASPVGCREGTRLAAQLTQLHT